MSATAAFDFDSLGEDVFGKKDVLELLDPTILSKMADASKAGLVDQLSESFTRFHTEAGVWPSQDLGSKMLNLAIEHDQPLTAKFLLANGVQVEARHVLIATSKHDIQLLELLLDHGWDINRPLGYNKPPALGFAVEDIHLIKWLLSRGADPNARSDILDVTPLSRAVEHGSFEVIKLLFKHGGDVARGELLHHAIWRDRPDRMQMISHLVHLGAPINKVMYEDFPVATDFAKAFGLGTPLHTAATRGDWEAARLLIGRGADISIEDSCGDTPISRAQAYGHREFVHHLQTH